MIYPEFIKENETIGICAPSSGVGDKLDTYELSLRTFNKKGYHILETASVRNDDARSASAKIRGEELNSLFLNHDVRTVMCASGGDFLDEMLPYANFKLMKKNPKWIVGFSDPTGILYPYTTVYDVATIYGSNASHYYQSPLPLFLKNTLKIMSGDIIPQKSSSKRLSKPPFLCDNLTFDIPSRWEGTVNKLDTEGRCIGGCIDALKDLIGTEYDGTKKFLKKYADDGFIWYFDNFSLSAEVFYRTLLQMRYAGWMKNAKAVIVGRVCFESSETGMTYEDAIHTALPDIPVLYQADVGHTMPAMTLINGAIMKLHYASHKASISFELK